MDQTISNKTDPIQQFSLWFDKAKNAGEPDPTATCLATAGSDGAPTARMVLLKQVNKEGFCVFTNYKSAKSSDLEMNPQAALCFHWRQPFHRQIRIRGGVVKMNRAESERYFHSRPRGSQIGALVSPQSQPIGSRSELVDKARILTEKYQDQDIPCPEHWGGYRLSPLVIEFWQNQDHRIHDRFYFERSNVASPWSFKILAP